MGSASRGVQRLNIGGYRNEKMDRRLRSKRSVVIESVSAREGAR